MIDSGQPPLPPADEVRARGRVGRMCHWLADQNPDDTPAEFLFALDTDGVRSPPDGFFTIPPTVPKAESLILLVRTAAAHGWLVGAAGRHRPGTQLYDVFDLYTEF